MSIDDHSGAKNCDEKGEHDAGALLDEEDREAILARRRLFIASALATMSLVACDRPAADPQPCLSQQPTTEVPDAGASIEPADAGASTPPDAAATSDAAIDASPGVADAA